MSGELAVGELVEQAKELVNSSSNPDRITLWRAYVAIERAILTLKLQYGLEREALPPKSGKRQADLATARLMLGRLDIVASYNNDDRKKLLYELRACRDVLKSLVAASANANNNSNDTTSSSNSNDNDNDDHHYYYY